MAPLRTVLAVADPEHWLALDSGVREVSWYGAAYGTRPLPEWERAGPLPADLSGPDANAAAGLAPLSPMKCAVQIATTCTSDGASTAR
ncbi:hypothetical protein ACIBKX_37930 [Streptomyces sp. NPDC050658]|uniref:hypothetical protein n=1 Tax=unclassified Streptomyces TaxID=2593676 RepID=UPI00341CF8E7